MKMRSLKVVFLSLLFSIPCQTQCFDHWHEVGIGAVITAAVSAIVYAFWPASDERVVKNSEQMYESTLQEHDMLLKHMESVVGKNSSWNIQEATLEELALRIPRVNIVHYTLRNKREELESALSKLKKRLSNLRNEQYIPEKKELYNRALQVEQSLSTLISRVKHMEVILHDNQNYFDFYQIRKDLERRYADELNGLSLQRILQQKRMLINNEFPLMAYEQKVSSDLKRLDVSSLSRYPQLHQQAMYMHNALSKYHKQVVSDPKYEHELLDFKAKELKRKEKEQNKKEKELRKKQQELENREFSQDVRGVGQFVTGVCQTIKQEEIERKKAALDRQHERQAYQQNQINKAQHASNQKEVVASIKADIMARVKNLTAYEIEQMRTNPPINPELLMPVDANYLWNKIVNLIQREIDNIDEPNRLLDTYSNQKLLPRIQAMVAHEFGVC